MADIGKSTTGHSKQDTQERRDIERLLVNWGNWLSFLPMPMSKGIAAPPTFREYVAGYRMVGESRTAENPDVAAFMDEIMATLNERCVCCLHCHYALALSSRDAARLLTATEHEDYKGERRKSDKTLKCSHMTYTGWLSAAVDAAELKLMFVGGLELDGRQLVKKRKAA